MQTPPIVSPEEWEAARLRLLVKEKELTKARDAMAAERRRMPWVEVDTSYEFDGPSGPASLLDLFGVDADRLDQATQAMAAVARQWDRRLAAIKRLAEAAHAEAQRATRAKPRA